MFYRALLRPLLFRCDPEAAHEQALHWAERVGQSRILRDTCETFLNVADNRLHQTVYGLDFPNPVGLAAGFDKNAVAIECWPAQGFGFVELGSVTARAQPGNDKPRLWRLPEQRAVINRMGFNNDGARSIARRVPPPPHRVPLGVNLGKSKVTALEDAAEDYQASLREFVGRADFLVINVSSPNTPGLRQLQEREWLDGLLGAVVARASGGAASREPHSQKASQELRPPSAHGRTLATPILLKLAPDLTFDQINDALELAQKHRLAGIVATNTTVDHPTPPEGGLSGAPLRARATACVRHIYRQTRGRLPIVGVGGIFTAADAYEKIRAGASLIEVWTGLIYEGPAIARDINRGLLRLLDRDGLYGIGEAVGAES